MAYTDSAAIAAHLGLTLTGDQETQAGVLSQAASDWIDDYLGRSWQAASPVTDEAHTIYGNKVYLNNRPVTAVTAVKTRGDYADASITTLSASQYELLDAQNGVLLVSGWAGAGALALVTYTHTAATPPTTVQHAATLIAAAWLGPVLMGLPSGLESVALGQNDINVKFAKTEAGSAAVPAEALTLLGAHRRFVVA